MILYVKSFLLIHKAATIKHTKLIFNNKNIIYSITLFICQGILIAVR